MLYYEVGVELLQLINVLDLLGLRDNGFFRVLLGSVFDIKDVICYAVGCLILGGYQVIKKKICSI